MFAKHTFIQLKSIKACSVLQNEPKCGNPCGEITQRMKGDEIKELSRKLVVGFDGRGKKKSSNEGRKMGGQVVKN